MSNAPLTVAARFALLVVTACSARDPLDGNGTTDAGDTAPTDAPAPSDGGGASLDASPPSPDAALTAPVPFTITIPTTGVTVDLVYRLDGRVEIVHMPARLRLLVRLVSTTTDVAALPGATPRAKCASYVGADAAALLPAAARDWGVVETRLEYAPGGPDFAALVADALAAHGLPSTPIVLDGPTISGLSVAHAFAAGAVSPRVPSSTSPGAASVAAVSADAIDRLVAGLFSTTMPTVTLRIGPVCDLFNGLLHVDGVVTGDQPIPLELTMP